MVQFPDCRQQIDRERKRGRERERGKKRNRESYIDRGRERLKVARDKKCKLQ